MTEAVFFDFDDTLGNREVYAYDCYKDILKENTNLTDPVEFEAVLQEVMIWDQKGDVNKKYVKDKLAEVFDIHLPYEDFNVYWDSVLWKYCVPLDGAEKTLEYLSKKYRIGLITNGPSDGQRNKLMKSGLSRFFDTDKIIVSGDYGVHKPDPRLFLKACEKLNVKPEESVYVGDIFARDVLGAYRAGMKPVWIWNGNRKCGADVTIIHRIEELCDIL